MKTASGSSKMMQLKEVSSLSSSEKLLKGFNPATLMMAVALYSIENKINDIVQTQKDIIEFLEVEKESQIKADAESLLEFVKNYKYNWDNELLVSSTLNLVMDIKKNARKNMVFYKEKVYRAISSKKLIVVKNKVNSALFDLKKKFKFYRLSLYIFSLASLMEIMLSGNFKEDYIIDIREIIRKESKEYRELFNDCSLYLEKLISNGAEARILKGVSEASKNAGKFINNIPLVKESVIDDFLQNKGYNLKQIANEMELKIIKTFASVANPETRMFIEKLDDIIKIYNQKAQICFDSKNIYIVS